MDVTPFATPPTVPEDDDIDLTVEVDFDNIGPRWIAIEDLVGAARR